jgi:hypothetical protein
MNNGTNRIVTDQEIMSILSSPEWQEKSFFMPIVNMVENNKIQTPQKLEIKVSNETVKSIMHKDVPVITDQANISIDKNENIIMRKELSDLDSVYSIDEEESYLFKRSSGSISSEKFTCNKILHQIESLTAKKKSGVMFEDLILDNQKSTGEIWVEKNLMGHFNLNDNNCKFSSF